jgi:predicted ATPase/transcriptional regulator with XRE-family HTH domain/Tfp pilus assembly protein PilF
VSPEQKLSFGTQLRVFRTRAGLTQEGLAERAGLGLATLKALERDQRQRPHMNTLVLLADALGLEPADRAALLDSSQSREHADTASTPVELPREPAIEPFSLPTEPMPGWLTSFVGREVEVETLHMLLDPLVSGVRLLTLIGPGGVGKTRLAVKAAADLSRAYADGVAFVDLAALSDARLVSATLTRALGLQETSGLGAHDLLVQHLRPRQFLLVLDTFEHLMGAVPLVAELLQECSQLALLTTSRTALQLRAERRLRIAPLGVPSASQVTLEEVADSPSVRLFVERAHAVAPEFVLDSSNAAAVAEVCRRLDGIPLAIELAAARAALLQPAALLQRLERRLPLLTRGAADLPERQQTLRQTLVWSHALLGSSEQVLFRRMAVFAGGATLDAIEAVSMLDDVLGPLAALVDDSLTFKTLDADDEPRFGMLESVREFAEERLLDTDEVDSTRRRHAAFFLEQAEQSVAQLRGPDQFVWLERMEHDHANLRAALDWLTEQNDLELALRLASATTWFWLRRAYFTDGERLFSLLSATEGQSGKLRASALIAAARLAAVVGDWDAQARYNAEALRLFSELEDPPGIAAAVTDVGIAYWEQGRLGQAEVHLQEGLRRVRALGDTGRIANTLLPLACVYRDKGEYETARPLFAEALALCRTLGDHVAAAHGLNNLGWLELYAGRLDAARSLAQESLAIRRANALPQAAAVSLALLGKVALVDGDLEVASARFAESLSLLRDSGYTWGIALTLEGVAGLITATRSEQALRLAAAANALRLSIGRPLAPAEQPLLEVWLAPARRAASAECAAHAIAEGAALSETQALAEAIELTTDARLISRPW